LVEKAWNTLIPRFSEKLTSLLFDITIGKNSMSKNFKWDEYLINYIYAAHINDKKLLLQHEGKILSSLPPGYKGTPKIREARQAFINKFHTELNIPRFSEQELNRAKRIPRGDRA